MCGAENSEGATFCRECGTELEDQTITPAIPVADEPEEDDFTLVSTPMPPELIIDAVAEPPDITPAAQFNEEHTPPASRPVPPIVEPEPPQPAEAEAAETPTSFDEAPPSPPASEPAVGQPAKSSSSRTMMYLLIGGLVVILLLCCCCSLLVGGLACADPGLIEDIIDELSQLPAFIPVS
jgi:hypothetical protein